jgi:hypothetical protein
MISKGSCGLGNRQHHLLSTAETGVGQHVKRRHDTEKDRARDPVSANLAVVSFYHCGGGASTAIPNVEFIVHFL